MVIQAMLEYRREFQVFFSGMAGNSRTETAKSLSVRTEALCGGVASAIATAIINPIEIVKTRLQLQRSSAPSTASLDMPHYRGVVHGLTTISHQEGFSALQRGVGSFVCYRFTLDGVRLGLYSPLRARLHNPNASSAQHLATDCMLGGFVGAISAVVSNPFMLVKTRQQAWTGTAATPQLGVAAELTQIVRVEGVKGWFRGLSAAIPRVFVGSSSQLASYELTKRTLIENGWCSASPSRSGRSLAGTPPHSVFSAENLSRMKLHFVSSLVSGVFVCAFVSPFEVVSSRLYAQRHGCSSAIYSGFTDCLVKMIRSEGIRSLFRGWTAMYAREGPATVLMLVLWEQLRYLAAPPSEVLTDPTM